MQVRSFKNRTPQDNGEPKMYDLTEKPEGTPQDNGGEAPVVQEPTEPVTPPQPESITEPTEENPAGSVPDSSLTQEPTPPVTPPVTTQYEIKDEDVFQTLSEKLGREVKSYEDLTPQPVDPFGGDQVLKEIAEFRQKTGRPVEDWLKAQVDYTQMGDLQVAREYLQYKYPSLNDDQINALVAKDYAPNEDDDAQEAMFRSIELTKFATEGRKALGEHKSQYNSPATPQLTQEMQQLLELGKAASADYQEAQKNQLAYNQGLAAASQKAETIPLALAEGLTIDFVTDEAGRRTLPQFINEMPHWRNADGSTNYQAVAEDGVKIRNFDKIISLVYQQGLNAGKDQLVRDVKNTNLGGNRSTMEQQPQGGKKTAIIDGDLNKFLGRNRMKVGK
jgi:hypothetical protein